MIYSNINREDDDFYPEVIRKALSIIRTADFFSKQYGITEVDGKKVLYLYRDFDTREKNDVYAEVHERHIDIQYLLKGREIIGFANRSQDNVVVKDDVKDNDILYYNKVKNETMLHMNAGDYAIFFPGDVHRPLVKTENCDKVIKVIFKIRVDAVK